MGFGSRVGICATAIVLIACCAMAADDGARVPLIVSKETTYITGPLNEDGTVNYVDHLYNLASAGVTPQNNAAIKYLLAVGPKGFESDNPKMRDAVLVHLKLRFPADGKYYVSLDEFVAATSGKTGKELAKAQSQARDESWKAGEMVWTAKDYPLLDQWLAENKAPLDLAIEAAKLDRFFIPLLSASDPPSMLTIWRPLELRRITDVTLALCARATRSLGGGDLDAAWTDVHAVFRLSRLLRPMHAMPIQHKVGLAAEERADHILVLIADRADLTRDRATAMMEHLCQLPKAAPFTRAAIECDRLLVLEICQDFWRDKPVAFGPNALPMLPGGVPMLDCNRLMFLCNQFYDDSLKALEAGDFPMVLREFEKVARGPADHARGGLTNEQWKGKYAAANKFQKMDMYTALVAGTLLHLDGGFSYMEEIECGMRTDLAIVGLALAAYRADNGQFPQSLEALGPKYLPQIPQDLFTGKPLIYRLEPDGGCAVSSPGGTLRRKGMADQGTGKLIVRLSAKKQ